VAKLASAQSYFRRIQTRLPEFCVEEGVVWAILNRESDAPLSQGAAPLTRRGRGSPKGKPCEDTLG
jgi:hypothetical protein